MQTLTVTVTDGMYEVISREAAKRVVSVEEVIDDVLLEGMRWGLPDSTPEEIDTFYAREEHHMEERRALNEHHETLAKNKLPPA